MKIGDRKTEQVHFGDSRPRTMTGTVVYIHPQRRFYTVEFKFTFGSLRESYFFPGRGGNE